MEKLNDFLKNNIYATATVLAVVFCSLYLYTASDRYEIVVNGDNCVKYNKATGESWVKIRNKWHLITDENKKEVDKFWKKQEDKYNKIFER